MSHNCSPTLNQLQLELGFVSLRWCNRWPPKKSLTDSSTICDDDRGLIGIERIDRDVKNKREAALTNEPTGY
jgi:hypothetical protein